MIKLGSSSLCILLAFFMCMSSAVFNTLNIPESWKYADDNATMNSVMSIKQKQWSECEKEGNCPLKGLKPLFDVKCVDGKADEYDCSNVDLLSFLPLDDLGCTGDANDIWGWTDVEGDGREYAIFCCKYGTSFIDVTVPTRPVVLGFMYTNSKNLGSTWRDAKVYKNHVYVVSEERDHGMQVLDLTRLRSLDGKKIETLGPDARYTGTSQVVLGSVHNIVINEESGFAYAVGAKSCRGGLHMINIQEPKNPKFAGCYADDGYTHDAQCIIYPQSYPDKKYHGREICFNYNEDTLTIVDVHDKDKPRLLSRTGYAGSMYTHQGWLIKDGTYLLANDELDEFYNTASPQRTGRRTRTMIWNVEDLKKPVLENSFYSSKQAIDHNLYIKNDLAYEANYCAGLRILNVSNAPEATEVGYFDVCPTCDSTEFFGSWSSYPYYESGTIVVSSIERGLFVVKYTGSE